VEVNAPLAQHTIIPSPAHGEISFDNTKNTIRRVPMSELFPTKTIAIEVVGCTDAYREYEFNHWYTKVHIPDLKQTPGIVDVYLYREMVLNLEERRAVLWVPAGESAQYVTLYRININVDDPWALMQKVKQEDKQRKMIDCMKSYEVTVWDFITYRRTVLPLQRPETHLPDGMPEAILVVPSDCVPTREDEYNDWYLYTHHHDLLETPGCVQASRFRSLNPKPAENEARYLALYEIDSDDPVAVFCRINEMDRDVRMPQGRLAATAFGPWPTKVGSCCRGLYQHVDF
jgi:hypothetical protein